MAVAATPDPDHAAGVASATADGDLRFFDTAGGGIGWITQTGAQKVPGSVVGQPFETRVGILVLTPKDDGVLVETLAGEVSEGVMIAGGVLGELPVRFPPHALVRSDPVARTLHRQDGLPD